MPVLVVLEVVSGRDLQLSSFHDNPPSSFSSSSSSLSFPPVPSASHLPGVHFTPIHASKEDHKYRCPIVRFLVRALDESSLNLHCELEHEENRLPPPPTSQRDLTSSSSRSRMVPSMGTGGSGRKRGGNKNERGIGSRGDSSLETVREESES